MKRTMYKISKVAVSILGAAFFIASFLMVCRMETEDLMPLTYETVGKVVHNEYINKNKTVVTININDKPYKYCAKRPVKLLTEFTVEMHTKGTLNKKDDALIDVIK